MTIKYWKSTNFRVQLILANDLLSLIFDAANFSRSQLFLLLFKTNDVKLTVIGLVWFVLL